MKPSKTPQRIAVLGSAFDPPTLGHHDVIKQCLDAFDEVWLVPAFSHAFDKKMSDYHHRVNLLNAFVDDIQLDNIKIKACEDKIKPSGKVYSIDLMQYLESKEMRPNDTLSLVIGPDNKKAFHRFKAFETLEKHYSPFVVQENVSFRSTHVREAIKAHKKFSEIITPGVARYISTNQLYTSDS